LEGQLARTLDSNVDITGAFNDSRVEKVSVQISEPTETHIESNDLKEYVATLPPTSQCARTMMNSNNGVFENVLAIQGVTYAFYEKDGTKISLNAALLKAIKPSPQYQENFENSDSLKNWLKAKHLLVQMPFQPVQTRFYDRSRRRYVAVRAALERRAEVELRFSGRAYTATIPPSTGKSIPVM
jgi:hypothetical protein